MENIAMCSESLMNKYLGNSCIDIIDVIEQIEKRNIFPCFFGSALKLDGIQELLEGIKKYTQSRKYSDDFGARVYKVGKDNQGNRLTYLKVTGGKLTVKQLIEYSIKNRQDNTKNDNIRQNSSDIVLYQNQIIDIYKQRIEYLENENKRLLDIISVKEQKELAKDIKYIGDSETMSFWDKLFHKFKK